MANRFRLATILRLRERERDHAAKLVEEVFRAIAILDSRIHELQLEYEKIDSTRQEYLVGEVRLQKLLDAQRYQLILVGQMQHFTQQKNAILEELKRRQANLLVKQQAVKAIEKLKENHEQQESQLQQRLLQSRIDEFSNFHSALQRQNNSHSS
jgi:flagellar protein FliJ